MLNKKILICILSVILLVGCNKNSHDYSFLMTHPEVLEYDAKRCQADTEFNRTPECDEVNRAAHDFFMLVSSRRENPELFDKDILASEGRLVAAEQALRAAPDNVGARQDLSDEREKVRVLLAVVKVTSTE